ncbi:MAG: hypothetical protein IBJ09_10285 [Bacteroidia bacterium]|nr:hypothetical protein [Bacteroidia bacterium]
MKKVCTLMLIAALCGLTACKKDGDKEPGGGGNGTNPPAGINYRLRVHAAQGYFASNPVDMNYDPDEASDYFMALFKPQDNGTHVRIRRSGPRLADLLLYFDGGTGMGTRTIVPHPAYPESNLVLLKADGSFNIKVVFPEQTAVQVSAYGAPGAALSGKLSGIFTHTETLSDPFTITEYDTELTVEFTIKRSE